MKVFSLLSLNGNLANFKKHKDKQTNHHLYGYLPICGILHTSVGCCLFVLGFARASVQINELLHTLFVQLKHPWGGMRDLLKMGVLKSWLIANLEIVLYVLVSLILLISFFVVGADHFVYLIIITAIILLISAMSIKHGIAGFFAALLCLLFSIGSIFFTDEFVEVVKPFLPWIIGTAIIAVIVGIIIAVCAYKNFDDVVSRRFFYRNSSASVFEESLKYAFNRQFAGFMLVMGISLEIMAMIGLSRVTNDSEIISNSKSAFTVIKDSFKEESNSSSLTKGQMDNETYAAPQNSTNDSKSKIEEQASTQATDQSSPQELQTIPSISSTIMNGYLTDGKQKYNIVMDIDIGKETSKNCFRVTGNYYYNQHEDTMIELDGTLKIGEDNNYQMILNSFQEMECFKLFSDEEKSFSGSWVKYSERSEYNKRTENYEKKLDVVLK